MAKFISEHIAVSTHKGAPAIVAFTNTIAKSDNNITTIKIDVENKKGNIIAWGSNNRYPQEIIDLVSVNGAASSGLRFLRKAHYGNGLCLYRETLNEKLEKKLQPVLLDTQQEIKNFFKKSQIKRFAKETIQDLEWWSMAMPEYVLSDNFASINRVKRQKTAWCRFEEPRESSGLIEYVYISESFNRKNVDLEGDYVEKVPLIDSYWSAEEVREYCKKNKIKKFIRPIFYSLLNESFYPQPEWHAIAKSGWLEVANSVPELKKHLFVNQITAKYLIEIDERYFENIYGRDWREKKPEDRIKVRQTVIDEINEGLAGNDNAGKSIQSMLLVDADGKQYSAVKISAIDDKLKDGSYLPEASAANSETLFALGIDPTLIGAGIPGGLGAGSGSDKRESFIILSALKKTDRETTIEPFEFIQDYNGWDDTIRFGFENTVLTTLDKNKTGTETKTE